MSSANDAELVRAAQAGDSQAFSTLFERWFDRSYDVAWRIVRNRDTAAEVAQDTFLAAYTKLESLRDPEAFGGWVLRTARNKALNRLEREGRSSAFATEDTVDMIDLGQSAADVADDIIRNEQLDLVWAASAALGERDASILDLHLRHDLDPGQIAEALDITPNAAHQTLFRLRKRLEGAIRSYVLWNEGQPHCGGLAGALDESGIGTFGPSAVKAISGHVASCAACGERQEAVLSPASMFAAVPLVAVFSGVREAAAAELIAHGVPIDPALAGSGPPFTPDQATTMTAIALAESGGETGAAPSAGEDSRGLWQINVASKRRKAAVAAVAALLLLLAGVVGAGLLDGGDSTEVETIAAPGTSQPSATTAAPAATTTEASTDTALPPTTETPSTEVPPPPTATDPAPASTEPPAPADPTPPSRPDPTTTSTDTTTSSTTTTSTTAAAPAPVVVRFTVAVEGGSCGTRGVGTVHALVWHTDHTDSVMLSGTPEVPAGPHEPSGRVLVCLLPDQFGGWQITANGPGGTATASTTT